MLYCHALDYSRMHSFNPGLPCLIALQLWSTLTEACHAVKRFAFRSLSTASTQVTQACTVAQQRHSPFSMLLNCYDAIWNILKFLLQQQVPTLMLATHTSSGSPVYSLSKIAYTLYTKQHSEYIAWVIAHMIMIMLIGGQEPHLTLFRINWNMTLYVMTWKEFLSLKV